MKIGIVYQKYQIKTKFTILSIYYLVYYSLAKDGLIGFLDRVLMPSCKGISSTSHHLSCSERKETRFFIFVSLYINGSCFFIFSVFKMQVLITLCCVLCIG